CNVTDTARAKRDEQANRFARVSRLRKHTNGRQHCGTEQHCTRCRNCVHVFISLMDVRPDAVRDAAPQSCPKLRPAFLTRLLQRAISVTRWRLNCTGVLPTGSAPSAAS